jgi:hypothetical protein
MGVTKPGAFPSAICFNCIQTAVQPPASTQSTKSSLKSCGMKLLNVSMCTNGQNFHPTRRVATHSRVSDWLYGCQNGYRLSDW